MSALLLIPLLFIFSLLFAVIGMTYTALISNILLFNYYFTLFITPLFLFSGIFFPIDTLPGWAQRVAWFTPLYHVVVACRGLISGSSMGSVLVSVAWITVLALALFLLPIWLMKRRLIK